jgi:ubiquinone/menaquinone biosynthesis C-methylase UbiE
MISTKTEIQRYYADQATAESYATERFTSELNRMLHKRQVVAVQGAIDRNRPARILEIAPGPGRLTKDIRPPGLLVCLEYNDAMIAQGRSATACTSAWVRGDAFKLPFTACFDLVYSFRLIRHFHRADRERIYAEVRRVLRPGGRCLLDAVNARVSGPSRAKRPDLFPVYDKLYERGELFEELTGAGLAPLSAQAVYKFKRYQYLSQGLLGPRVNWLNRLVINALERLPRRDGEEWIIECRRA